MQIDYNVIIQERANHVFNVMAPRVSVEDMARIKAAFELAREAHEPQKRKTGEPYILHPIAVANIAAEELRLGANPVIACFLHDVVEDTPYTIEDIRERFGDDVAFLVRVVTKKATKDYEMSKQLDNYRQLLGSVQYDIRAILVKLADRLHNMRTLASMKPEKQMKIAGETDYFYAPLANRLGLYDIKTELENLSFRFRCPEEYENISNLIDSYKKANGEKLESLKTEIEQLLKEAHIKATVSIIYRQPLSIRRKIEKYGEDFNHLRFPHYFEIVFDDNQKGLSDKELALMIYCRLTDRFKELHDSMTNYMDAPKGNGYQSIHFKVLSDFGRWQEIHVCSKSMLQKAQLGCVAERTEENLQNWIDKFRKVLHEIIVKPRNERYMDDVRASFYNDDIQVFTPKGDKIILPQGSTAIDFAYEVDTGLGNRAYYTRINGRLEPITTTLNRGDIVEIFTDDTVVPTKEWDFYARTYRAHKAINQYLENCPKPTYCRCNICNPIPGEEIIGIRSQKDKSQITVHKRDCSEAISLASSFGDDVVSVDFSPNETLYPVTLSVRAVDRHHLLIDLADCITNTLNLVIDSFNTHKDHGIVECAISFGIHSNDELKTIITHLCAIKGVDEVTRIKE